MADENQAPADAEALAPENGGPVEAPIEPVETHVTAPDPLADGGEPPANAKASPAPYFPPLADDERPDANANTFGHPAGNDVQNR